MKQPKQNIENNMVELPCMQLTIVRGAAGFTQEEITILSRGYNAEQCVGMFEHILSRYSQLDKNKNAKDAKSFG
jgi:hypothetical protein